MRRAISDPTAGERGRTIERNPDRSVRHMDPTDPRYRDRRVTSRGSDPGDPRPVGLTFGRRRGEAPATADPDAPVLRLRGFGTRRKGA
jgi:hypothetical protein